jgi:hypothetical protein
MEITYVLTYLLHGAVYCLKSWLSLSLSKNILPYWTRRFITIFTKARHWTVSWASWIQFVSSFTISLRSSLMLSSHIRLGLPNGLLPSGLPSKILSHPSHPPGFNHPNNVRWRIQAVKFIIMQFSLWSVYFPFLSPDIFLNTPFSKTISLCSSPKVRYQVSHPYSTTGKITVSQWVTVYCF